MENAKVCFYPSRRDKPQPTYIFTLLAPLIDHATLQHSEYRLDANTLLITVFTKRRVFTYLCMQ